MGYRTQGGLAVASLLLAGCASDLAVTKVGPDGDVAGYPYRLKMTQFTVPVIWRVTACDPTKPDGLKIKVSADVTSATVNDPAHFYAIDPRSLGGPFRNTEFSMEWYENRGLKAISSSADDQTGTVLTNVATGLAKLAGVGLGFPAGPADTTCPPEIKAALTAIGDDQNPGLAAKVDATEAKVAAQTLLVAQLTARAASFRDYVDERTRRELGDAVRLLDALNSQLKLEKAALEEQLKVVTAKEPVTFPSDGKTMVRGPIDLPAQQQKDWNVNPGTIQAVQVYLRLQPLEVLTSQSSSGKPATARPRKGLPYREPVLSRLEVCSPAACGDPASKVIKKFDAPVLQTGRMFYLPFEARTFANIKSGATFSEGGVLMTATFNQPRAAGVGASETFQGVSEQAAAFVTAQRGAETARINAKVAQAKAQKELNDAVTALVPPAPGAAPTAEQLAIAAYQADAALAKAETTAIEATLARDAARAMLAATQ